MKYSKVYLVTRRASYNYGSSLQAYALQQLLNRYAGMCEILDVKEMRLRGKLRLWVLNMLGFIALKCPMLKNIIGEKIYIILKDSYLQRKKFDHFNNEILNVSIPLHSDKKLSKYIGAGNLVVCGSDQIWNPLGFSPTMFLSFVDPKGNVLASYAPSFGLSSLSMHVDEIARLVNRFHFLSVREQSGMELLKQITVKDVVMVLDPTLLLSSEEWKSQMKIVENLPKRYLLCYFLSTDIVPHDEIKQYAKEHNLGILNLQTNYSHIDIEGAVNRTDIGPQEFLYVVSNAEKVFTNSFHCCIFSHIFNKNFTVYSRFADGDKANQNTRISHLLDIIGEPYRWKGRESYEGGHGCETEMRHQSIAFIESIVK